MNKLCVSAFEHVLFASVRLRLRSPSLLWVYMLFLFSWDTLKMYKTPLEFLDDFGTPFTVNICTKMGFYKLKKNPS